MKTLGKVLLWIAAIGILVMLPAAGSRLFNAVTGKLSDKDPAPVELKDIGGAPAGAVTAAKAVPEEDAEAAKERYLEGLKYFKEEDYEKAREEWEAAARLDPNNIEARKGLKRIDALLNKP